MDNFIFRPVSNITIGLLAFFAWRTCCSVLLSSGLRGIFVVFWINPLGPISLGNADVTVRISCQHYNQNSLIYEILLWHFLFFVFVFGLDETFIYRLLYRCYLCCQHYGWTYIVSYFIVKFFWQHYDRTFLVVILLRDLFDQQSFSTNIPAAAASMCVATVHCRRITKGLLSKNVGSTI